MRRLFASLIVLALVVPLRVSADDADEARFHDGLARGHYEARRFEQALREFFAAARLAPNPRLTFNIAVCLDLLQRGDEAYLYLREYAASDDTDAGRREFARTALTRLEQSVARVAVSSDPPGATVYVDQRDLGSYGQTPRVLALAPGPHTITLVRDGHRTATLDVVAVRGSEVAANAALPRILGALRVRAASPGTAIVREVDGPVVAEGPLPLEAALPPGVYDVQLDAPGFRTSRGVARVTADATSEWEPTLEALPPPRGELTVTSSVAGALIEVDGQPAGFAPTLLSSLAAGTRRVRVSHSGLAPWEGEVEVGPRDRGWLTVALEPPSITRHSDATWVVGGLGTASVVTGAVLYVLAAEARARFDDALQTVESGGTLAGTTPGAIRAEGVSYAVAGDALVGVGVVSLAVSVLLYLLTEETDTRVSRATFATSPR